MTDPQSLAFLWGGEEFPRFLIVRKSSVCVHSNFLMMGPVSTTNLRSPGRKRILSMLWDTNLCSLGLYLLLIAGYLGFIFCNLLPTCCRS